MRNESRRVKLFSILTVILLLPLLTACSSPSAEPAPEADTSQSSEQASSEDTATAQESEEIPTDDYQAQRESCTWETPCWPSISDTMPDSFSEAPMLAELVAAGGLPSVVERLPKEPLVIEPGEMIGQYGGTWQRAFTGPGDRQNIERMNNDYTLFWDTSATELRPRLAKDWESNDDATEWTIYLRDWSSSTQILWVKRRPTQKPKRQALKAGISIFWRGTTHT